MIVIFPSSEYTGIVIKRIPLFVFLSLFFSVVTCAEQHETKIDRAYDDSVTRHETWMSRLGTWGEKTFGAQTFFHQFHNRMSPLEMVRLELYKRSVYRDWFKARWDLPQKWLIVAPAGINALLRSQTVSAPAHWQTDVISFPKNANALEYANNHSLIEGHTFITLIEPGQNFGFEALLENARKLMRDEKIIVVENPKTFWAQRYLTHVEPFKGTDLRKWPLPSKKNIVILEPHADDTFLSMAHTLQQLLLRKNHITVIGLIRENKPNQLAASGLHGDFKMKNAQRDAIRRRENLRAFEDLYNDIEGDKKGLAPIEYEALELGIGGGIGGNAELGHTILELHTPGAVTKERLSLLTNTLERLKPDLLITIDALDSHPDHVASGRLAVMAARETAKRINRDLPLWLFRGFSNKREDFGSVTGLAIPLSEQESTHKEALGTDAYYSQRGTFHLLYDKRLRNFWWTKSLSLGNPAEVEAFIQFEVRR